MKTVVFGILFLGVLAGCSKSDSTQTVNSTPVEVVNTASLRLHNVWMLQVTPGLYYGVYELENVGAKPIKAFAATCSIVDDLDRVIGEMPLEFTSDTKYASAAKDAPVAQHSIAVRETICLVTLAVTGEPEQTFSIAKKDLYDIVPKGMTKEEFDRGLVKKKINFSTQKIVAAE